MNSPQPHQNRHGVAGLQTSAFSEDEIAQANKSHDQRMGWSEKYARLYTNPRRHPETFTGKIRDIWEKQA